MSSSLTITRSVCGSPSDTYNGCFRLSAGAVSRVRSSASSPGAVMVRQSTGQMSMHASHSMQSGAVKCVCTSQLRQRSTSRAVCSASKPSSTSVLRRRSRSPSSTCVILARDAGSK